MSDTIKTLECPYCKQNFIPHTPDDFDTIEDLQDRIAELEAEVETSDKHYRTLDEMYQVEKADNKRLREALMQSLWGCLAWQVTADAATIQDVIDRCLKELGWTMTEAKQALAKADEYRSITRKVD